jgi:hypothetical protein
VLLRLAFLGVTNALAMLRLLPMSDRAKDAEILALRYQLTVLKRQLQSLARASCPLIAQLPARSDAAQERRAGKIPSW